MTRRVPLVGGEKESLWAALDRHRDVVLWKVADLDDEQLRRVRSDRTLSDDTLSMGAGRRR